MGHLSESRTYREWLEEALALDRERWEELEKELARLRHLPRRPLSGRFSTEEHEEQAKAA